jgi:hypothetical protein
MRAGARWPVAGACCSAVRRGDARRVALRNGATRSARGTVMLMQTDVEGSTRACCATAYPEHPRLRMGPPIGEPPHQADDRRRRSLPSAGRPRNDRERAAQPPKNKARSESMENGDTDAPLLKCVLPDVVDRVSGGVVEVAQQMQGPACSRR